MPGILWQVMQPWAIATSSALNSSARATDPARVTKAALSTSSNPTGKAARLPQARLAGLFFIEESTPGRCGSGERWVEGDVPR
jgi:hypothetical protein